MSYRKEPKQMLSSWSMKGKYKKAETETHIFDIFISVIDNSINS